MSVKKILDSLIGKPDKYSARSGAAHQTMHIRLDRLSNYLNPEKLFIYANIRNPFDRIVSIYFYRKQRGRYPTFTFEDFFYNVYLKPKSVPEGPIHPMILNRGRRVPNLTVIKLENASSLWPKILKKHFKKEVKLPRINRSKHKSSLTYYTNEMKNLVKVHDNWVIRHYYPQLLSI